MKRIVVTGAAGQIGTEMVSALRERYGRSNVLATDIRIPDSSASSGPFALADVTIGDSLDAAVARHRADTIFHLAAILSAVGEQRPQKTYEVNIGGLFNVLEVARERDCAVFTPSSIAAFG
ncbi:MAG: NAD-dependent epimerase/dehydratase family protein, partial [Halobacteriales archaeon]|nr:NAD-dependent epimerase/dehydratase family protein [Halobacteriales archaeon]